MTRSTYLMTCAMTALIAIYSTTTARAAAVDAFWIGGASNWNDTAHWLGGVVPNNGVDTFSVFIDNGDVAASSATLDIDVFITNLTIDADDSLSINNARRLRVVAGTIDNAGTITLGSTGSNTYLHPRGGPVTLTGGGTLALTDTDNNWIYQEAGGSLINIDNTIRGSGFLGWTSSPTNFDNQGTIVADQPTPLLIEGGGSAIFTNTGIVRADAGATLQFFSAFVDNTNGVIEALDNSTVSIHSSTIEGGTLQTSGTGVIESNNTLAAIDGSTQTVNNSGTLRVPNGNAIYAVGTINNTGVIEIASTGSNTLIYPSGGPLTLTGSGSVSMGSGSNAWIRQNGGGSLININNTIHGSGNIGWTSAPTNIDNQGSIIADLASPLTVQGGAGVTFTNTGTVRAEAGATLQFFSANVDNTDGLIEADDNSRVSISTSTIHGGTLNTIGSGAIETENTSTAINGTVQTVNNNGTLRVLNGDALFAVGTINNMGTIEIASTGSSTHLYPSGGPLTLTGGGTVSIGSGPNAWIRQNGGGSLINVNNTIHGSGNIGWTAAPTNIDNQGTIIADQASPLTIQGGPNSTFTNTGSARAENNATLAFASATVTNTGGVIEARDGSTVTLASTVVTGGTLQTLGTGEFRTSDALSALVDLTNAGQFRIPNATRLYLNGTIHNTGTLRLDSSGANTYCYLNLAPVMLTGGGIVEMSNASANWIHQQGNGSLVNVDNTIRGSGRLGNTSAPTNITNQALVVADQPTPLRIQGGANVSFTNTGTIRAENGATCALETVAVNNAGGVIEALDGSIVSLASAGIDSGTLQTAGSGEIRTADTLSNFVNVTTTGQVRLPNATRLYLNGTINNSGTISLDAVGSNTYIYVNSDPVTLTGGGTIELSDTTRNWIYQQNSGSLVNADNTIRGAGNLGWTGAATDITNQGTIIADGVAPLVCSSGSNALFDNQGVMIVDGPGGMQIVSNFTTSGNVTVNATRTLSRTGAYTQTNGSTIVNGTLNVNGAIDIQAGTLGGNGTIMGDVTNSGSVSPGNSIGELTLDDDYIQTSSGELFVELNDMSNDRLVVAGNASLDGTLRLDFANDPAVGTTYEVMTYASHSGEFSEIDVPCLLNGKSVYVSYGPTAVVLTIGGSLLADVNCDCALTATDVELFTLALLDSAAYDVATPNCIGLDAVDLNNDGLVNGLDIQPFMSEFLP